MSTFCEFYQHNLLSASVDQKWDEFVTALTSSLEKHVPHKRTSSRHNLPWFTRVHRRLCKKKQKLYNKAKKTNQPEDWASFRKIRKTLHQELSKSRNQYTSEFLAEACKSNTKAFWSHIKKTSSNEVGVADLDINGTLVSDPKAKAEALNSQFCSVFTTEDSNNPS